ncbi:phage antirepressor N-terminal domain-containing protein [Alcaligenes sp. SDU_A2]|uniref:phage antirepressor N-terminal domain-containing protein n=1 Tax=Alcaligenes sp. SDU_A2 TaxID=3136634 RepID=UPI00311FB9C3
MSEIQSVPATVDFHGNPLTVVTAADGQRLVAMRPICEAIGVQWEAQLKRIKRDPVLSEAMSIMDIPSLGGEQSTVCLPLEYLNGWLFGISTSRVKPEIRQRLEDYQRECYQVLNAYWSGEQDSNPRVPQQSEILVAQAYARAAEAADIVSRHVFQAVLNGQVTSSKTKVPLFSWLCGFILRLMGLATLNEKAHVHSRANIGLRLFCRAWQRLPWAGPCGRPSGLPGSFSPVRQPARVLPTSFGDVVAGLLGRKGASHV